MSKVQKDKLSENSEFCVTSAARYLKIPLPNFGYYVYNGRGPEHSRVAGRIIYTKKQLDDWEVPKHRPGRKPGQKSKRANA